MSLDQIDFVCISLDFRADRRAQIKDMFEQLGISDRINWWIVSKHPQGGIYGCFESHYSVWNCPQFKRPYLCVFEDDLGINPLSFGASTSASTGSTGSSRNQSRSDPKERFKALLKYVQRNCPRKFDLINLEPKLGFKQDLISKELGEVWTGFFFHTGSYIVSRASLPEISTRIRSWYGMDIDTSLYQNCRMAGLFPPMFIQIDQDSNNDGGWRDLFGRSSPQRRTQSISQSNQPWWGWLIAEMAQLGSWYLLLGKAQPELIDRRIK